MGETQAAAAAGPARRSAIAADVHPLKDPRILVPLLALLAVVHLPFLHAALWSGPEVTQAVPFKDDFNRASLGPDYHSNGGAWRIVDGQLYSPGVGNNPLWLRARLPADVRISFDFRSEGPDGDVKFEAFGDGRNHATGYLFLFGAWHNTQAVIAKLDEHSLPEAEQKARLASVARPFVRPDENFFDKLAAPFQQWQARRDLARLEAGTYYETETPFLVRRRDLKVVKGKTYQTVVTKKGGLIRWEIDGQLVHELRDPAPLSGKGHDRFGFSSWQNDTYFDNLKIEPL